MFQRRFSLGFVSIVLLCLLGCTDSIEESGDPVPSGLNLLPQPTFVEIHSGEVQLPFDFTIFHHPKAVNTARLLADQINQDFGFAPKLEEENFNILTMSNGIHLELDERNDPKAGAYQLASFKSALLLSAKDELGLFHASQTLRQVLRQTLSPEKKRFTLPEFAIEDSPRFEHRGMLLDVCRHYFDKEIVKKYIDLLAHYKMNVLHWHLTEDQGWRLAIDKYPKLTEVGAWRKDSLGNDYGGFYTKADIREVVTYAQERHITIIPEIEMPGHAQAALAAYPQFSCKGHDIEVITDWGVFKEIYCAGNDSTFVFLEDVLTEVMELFPSPYIHIGGDEAPKYRWEHCDKCQKRMKEEGLEDEHGLQSYFISRVEKFLNDNGRQLIGWDEILEGGLAPNATLQSWRGMDHGKHAAESEHNVIMSPTSHCYLDYDLKSIDLKKVYNFEPIPEDLDPNFHRYIIGGECNMWTEHVPDEATLDSKVFPRMMAMAEVLWSDKEDRDFPSFLERTRAQYPFLKEQGVQYGWEGISAQLHSVNRGGSQQLELEAGVPGLDLFYSYAGSTPKKYDHAISIEHSGLLTVSAKLDGSDYGSPMTQEVSSHTALGVAPILENEYNQWYTAGGEGALTNSLLGSLDFRDGNWQGYWGSDLVASIDLGDTSASEVSMNFYQYNNAWIFLPKKVSLWISPDDQNWELVEAKLLVGTPEQRGKFIEEVTFNLPTDTEVKFIKVAAENLGKVPDWHEAAGSDAWIFVDEIIVK